jgi:Tol biopolymer transport system component
VGFVAWSPDGAELAAQQRRGETDRVVLVSPQTGAVRSLTDGEQDWAYSFSPDGRRVAFARFREGVWNLWWVDREGAEVQLTDHTELHSYVRYPAWSPTGEGIAYEYAESRGNIWRLQLR